MAARIKTPGEAGYGLFSVAVLKKYLDQKQVKLEELVVGAVYKHGRHDKGLMLNFCPWCGASLDWFREDKGIKEEKPEGEQADDVQA
jgi:hypothetical protein